MKDHLFLLDSDLLSDSNKKDIKKLYRVLENRKVLNLIDELENIDRIKFDKKILNSFGIGGYYDEIKESLINLYKIRKSVND